MSVMLLSLISSGRGLSAVSLIERITGYENFSRKLKYQILTQALSANSNQAINLNLNLKVNAKILAWLLPLM